MFLLNGIKSIFIEKKGEIDSLNGLRALAILSILFFHAVPTLEVVGWGQTITAQVFQTLDSGVSLFFVLSGYLISFGLKREWNQSTKLNFRMFFIKRSLRIFPAYYFYLLITYLVMTAAIKKGGEISLNGEMVDPAASIITLYQNFKYDLVYLSDYFRSYNNHAWSLSVEEKFYLIFPVFAGFLLFPMKEKNRFAFLMFLYILPLIFRIYSTLTSGPRIVAFHEFHFRYDDLLAGILVMEVLNKEKLKNKLTEHRYFILGIAGILYISNIYLLNSHYVLYKNTFAYNIFSLSFSLFLIFSLLGKNFFSGLLSSPVFRPISRLSYTMYLWNQLLIPIAFQSLANPLKTTGIVTNLQMATAILQFFIITSIVCAILYVLIEYPFLLWKSKLTQKTEGAPT